MPLAKDIQNELKTTLTGLVKEKITLQRETAIFCGEIVTNLFEKNPSFEDFLNTLDSAIKAARLNPDQSKHFKKNKVYKAIPRVQTFLAQVSEQIADRIQSQKEIKEIAIAFTFNSEEYQRDMSTYLTQRYREVDLREQIEARNLRRLDSLSRLFMLKAGLSGCSAATIHRGKLYISLNCAKEKMQDEIVRSIEQRISFIKDHLDHAATLTPEEYNEQHDTLASALYMKLIQQGGTTASKEIFTQAIDKLTDAVIYDKTTFNLDTREALSNGLKNYRLLLPSIKNERSAPHIVKFKYQDGEKNQSAIELPFLGRGGSVSDIHAEQMLAFYIFQHKSAKEYNQDDPLKIGISRLCCKTCETNLADLPTQTRGSHGIFSESTRSLIIPTLEEKHLSTPTKGTTEARKSPEKSARKRREGEHTSSQTHPSRAKRQLFFEKENIPPSESNDASKESIHDDLGILSDHKLNK